MSCPHCKKILICKNCGNEVTDHHLLQAAARKAGKSRSKRKIAAVTKNLPKPQYVVLGPNGKVFSYHMNKERADLVAARRSRVTGEEYISKRL